MPSQSDLEMRVLMYIEEHDQGHGQEPASVEGIRQEFGALEGPAAAAALRQNRRLIVDEYRGGGYHITAAGRGVIQALRTRQADRGLRRPAARIALLRWLEAQEAHDPSSRVARSDFDGVLDMSPFTDAETAKAADYLRTHHLVGGIDAAQESSILLWITEAGQECLDSGRSLEEFVARTSNQVAPSYVVNQHVGGSIGANSIGDRSTATATVTGIDVKAIRQIAATIRQAEASLDLPPEAEPLLVQIETADDPNLVQRALGQLVLLVNGTAAGLITAMAAPHLPLH